MPDRVGCAGSTVKRGNPPKLPSVPSVASGRQADVKNRARDVVETSEPAEFAHHTGFHGSDGRERSSGRACWRGRSVIDVVFVLLTLGLFAALALVARAVERL
ncbi:hypothetical protein I0C86_02375 [Plantactinospora sp. S1510]|uniref:Uncharacterized protein n=1 Tax=Plantactinospora alkalitolerans TaxID=2789879 RepID=A0ABS0GNT0_9ACTN|nr:hypothetical protein [Plantactinospora alkalitolerans]MBF9127848.1 hypothetical protein [Plantactinospora alkalitolerans]